jgi:hypothetical protein
LSAWGLGHPVSDVACDSVGRESTVARLVGLVNLVSDGVVHKWVLLHHIRTQAGAVLNTKVQVYEAVGNT